LITIQIEICIGTTCHLMGAADILNVLEILRDGVDDAVLDISLATCLGDGECTGGPKVRVDGQLLTRATTDSVKEAIVNRIRTIRGE
jgi:NADH:ubiquinone oxidoreductase subunit E